MILKTNVPKPHTPQQCPFCGAFLPPFKSDQRVCGKCGTTYVADLEPKGGKP